ncbi:MAG: nucleotidyltransferase, partial [Chloroflexi bacterium]|nr:nucleotidyltransferase [Chloroflexota bacterium]
MDTRLEDSLRSVTAFLEEHGYRYAIVGGIAVSQWGFVRITRDVDFKVLVPDINYSAVRAVIRAAFPERARADLDDPLVTSVYVKGVIVDFLLALPGYEQQIVGRAVQRDLGGFSAWICSAEDLIVQKVAAGRGRDWQDVEGLLIEQLGKLDEAYVEYWVTQFAEALEKPEILTDYGRLL